MNNRKTEFLWKGGLAVSLISTSLGMLKISNIPVSQSTKTFSSKRIWALYPRPVELWCRWNLEKMGDMLDPMTLCHIWVGFIPTLLRCFYSWKSQNLISPPSCPCHEDDSRACHPSQRIWYLMPSVDWINAVAEGVALLFAASFRRLGIIDALKFPNMYD